jgi:hypothetical protein
MKSPYYQAVKPYFSYHFDGDEFILYKVNNKKMLQKVAELEAKFPDENDSDHLSNALSEWIRKEGEVACFVASVFRTL